MSVYMQGSPASCLAQPYLSGGVNDFRGKVLALVLDHTAKGILDCRIVALDKMAIDKLDSERRFALDRSASDARIECEPN